MSDNSTLPEPVAALLRAVHDALDLPLPSIAVAAERAHNRVMTDRARHARIAVEGVLNRGHDPGNAAAWLRGVTAETPATYTPWQPPGDEQRAAKGCTHPPGEPCFGKPVSGPVFEVEPSGADSHGWDPDDPHGHVDEYERGES